jgi:hypothetical protein
MSHQRQRADYGTVSLAGYAMKLASGVNESIVNIHSRPITQGDPGPHDHPTNSTWIQSDWTGGGQVHIGHPDVVTGRFDFATSETAPAKTITLPPLPDEWADPALTGNDCIGLGVYDNKEWAAWGADIRSFNHGTDAWDDMGTNLTGSPVKKGCVFVPKTGALAGVDLFCIPLGSSFDYVNGTTRTNVAKSAADLIVYDNKLFRVGTDGSFEYTTDLSAWSGVTYVSDGSTPRGLQIYLTVGGEPTVYVITSAGVWVWDSISNTLLESQLQYPRHPDQGKGSSVWRGELWTSVADGAHRYNRSTISPQGLDSEQGLPDQYRGVIVDMEPSYNNLYALLSGIAEETEQPTDETYFHTGDDYMTGASSQAASLLMKWNGFGWHYVADMYGSAPTTVFVSDAQDDYAVWWAADKKMYRVPLTRTYTNLKTNETIPVKTSSWFESAWYNYGWEGQTKVLKSFDIFVESASATEYVDVFYKLDNDDDSAWLTMGRIESPGEHSFFFNLAPGATLGSEDPNDYIGLACESVKFRFELHRGDNVYAKPIIKWFAAIARKMLRPSRTFRVVMNLSRTHDYPVQVLREALLDAVTTPGATEFVYMNETLQVDLVALEFSMMENIQEQSAGTKVEYIAKVNLIESNESLLRP